ncbi:uncharacterized protein LOC135845406 isoform X5 [Planococcus citri]|uniref:uncharacterized protein LOC135845406 isoform X5 n=1 Tax=Planococcus citri TaxID=170843 RepID=UPI0031F7FEE8
MMAANDKEVLADENNLIPHNSPGQLQELACVIASASIWCYKVKECRRNNGLHLSHISQLPTVLRKMIDRCIKVVEHHIREWRRFHDSCIFSHHKRRWGIVDELVMFISWHADGTIHRKQTAKNLVECSVLSNVEKYEIACIYCLVDDVKKLWPTTTDLEHPLIDYWNCRMSGEHDSMEVDPECSCVEASLLKKSAANTWPAFEYLWGFLTDDEQVQKVTKMSGAEDSKFLQYALCMLNEIQLERVMVSSSGAIFKSLYEYHESDVWVMRIWNRVKNVITGDAFYKIILALLEVYPRGGGHGASFKIWTSASDAMRNHILANHLEEILEMSCSFYYHSYSSTGMCKDGRFLVEMLSTKNAETRETIWRERWYQIIIGMPPEYLQQIITLCLGSDDKIASFKKVYLNDYNKIFRYCLDIVENGHFRELSEFFQFCSDEPEVIFTLRMKVLNLPSLFECTDLHRKPETMDSFDMFLRETFLNANQLNEFKRNWFLGEEAIEFFKIKNNLGNLINFTDHVLSSVPEVLVLVKNKVFESSHDILISVEDECVDWNKFIKWCLHGDDEAVENFKVSLPINQIFEGILEKTLNRLKWHMDHCVGLDYKVYENFRSYASWLNVFLEWVFSTEEAIHNFKCDRLLALKNSEQIKYYIFESNDERLIDSFLEWFCDKDECEMEMFDDSFLHLNLNDGRGPDDKSDLSWRCKLPFLN